MDVFSSCSMSSHVIVLSVAILSAIWILGRSSRFDCMSRKKCCRSRRSPVSRNARTAWMTENTRGTCPECGFYYTFANCKWAWRHLRKDKNNPPTPPPFLVPGEERP